MYPLADLSLYSVDATADHELISSKLREHGVVVINDFYNSSECNKFIHTYVDDCLTIINQLPTVKPGQYKDIICHHPMLWQYRKDQKLIDLFSNMYRILQEYDGPILSSIDGVNIKSPYKSPFYDKVTNRDWAHLDQTNGELFDSIQGQIVFNQSTGGFVCSPKSHMIYNRVMEIMGIAKTDFSNWCKISRNASAEQEQIMKDLLTSIGGHWQQLFIVPPGSVILWLSTVIHSAKTTDKPRKVPKHLKDNDYTGWRIVMYISYRPLNKFTREEKRKRHEAMKNNMSMNHSSQKLWISPKTGNPKVDKLLNNPIEWKYFDKDLINKIIEEEEEIDL